MLYTQSFHEHTPKVSFQPTIRLDKKLDYTIPTSRSPFIPSRIVLRIRKKFLLFLAKVATSFFKQNLYCTEHNAILYQLSPETRSLLSWLIEKKVIESWRFIGIVPGYGKIKVIALRVAAMHDPEGQQFRLTGANGVGVGVTYQEAVLPALGELIERIASAAYWWEDTTHFRALYRSGGKMLDPNLFCFLTKDQVKEINDKRYIKSYNLKKQLITWKPVQDLVSGKKFYTPASFCYMSARIGMTDNPYTVEVSSNGVAAHTNYKEACTRALLEYIERDHFLKSWYHKKAGRNVCLNSLQKDFPVAKNILESDKTDVQTHLIDITDDLGVPVMVGLRVNQLKESRAIQVTASAGLSYKEAIEKCLNELLRFNNISYYESDKEVPKSFQEMKDRSFNISSRGELWSYNEMIQYIDWYCRGKKISYQALSNRESDMDSDLSYSERYALLQKICKNNNIRVYAADLTNSIARYAGLKVVRVLTPDLIPMFFTEQLMPLTNSRLLPKHMKPKDLYQVPHPFL